MYSRQDIADALKTFTPFVECSDEELDQIAEVATVAEYPPDLELFHFGDNDSQDFFLLDGALLLSAQDGQAHSLMSGSDRAKHPVSRLRPRQYSAKTQTESHIIVVDNKLFNQIKRRAHDQKAHRPASGQAAERGLEPDQALIMLHAFVEQKKLGKRTLPPKKPLLNDLLSAIKSGELIGKVSVEVCQDETIETPMIHLANSGAYRSGSVCTQGLQAMERIGLDAYYFALGMTARNVFMTLAENKIESYQVWRRTVDRAAIVWLLADLTGITSPARAMSLSLLHHVGAPVAISFLRDHEDFYKTVQAAPPIREKFYSAISEMVLQEWGLPDEIAKLPHYASDWHYTASRSKAGVGNFLQMAAYLQYSLLAPDPPPLPEITDLSSYGNLALFENRLTKPDTLRQEIVEAVGRARQMLGER